MITIEIDGKTIELEKPIPVLEAAKQVGVDVAHYCYHPKLSIAGQCRMCVCKVEMGGKPMPKLQIACNTMASDGMKVSFQDQEVKDVVRGVLELHLVNHPIDCPICDQAGECKLQDFYMEHGLHQSRIHLEDKDHKPKQRRIGRSVVLDNERCIMCTRCVRFFDEITHEKELTIENRGNHSLITTTFGELKSHYAQNVVDICPVGALTDERFRFKQRVWFLEENQGICPGCARGCNLFAHHKDNTLYRVKPRQNDAVNSTWLCDQARVSFEYPGLGARLGAVSLKRYAMKEPAPWKTALDYLHEALTGAGSEETLLVGSAQLSNEANYLLGVLGEKTGAAVYATVKAYAETDGPNEDKLLVLADKNPNTQGAKRLGLKTFDDAANAEAFLSALESGKVKVLYVCGLDPTLSQNIDPARYEAALKKVEKVIYQSPFEGATQKAALLELPAAAFYETSGTYTNHEGRVQQADMALWPPGDSLMDWEILSRLLKLFDPKVNYQSAGMVYEAMAAGHETFKNASLDAVAQEGVLV